MRRIFVVAVCISAFAAIPVVGGARLSIDGSRTMFALNAAMVKRFEQSHPGLTISVADNGTGRAFDAVAHRKVDIGAVTHGIRPEDRRAFSAAGAEPVLVPIAIEGISIYVHPRNAVNSLTVDQVAAIYNGAITNWKEVGGADAPIHVNSFDDGTGRYWYMADDVMHRKPMAREVRFTDRFPNARSAAAALEEREQQMLGWVSSDPNAIGFGDLKKIRVVKIVRIGTTASTSVLPTPSDLKAGRYPFARRLAYLTRQPVDRSVEEFIRWAREQHDLIRDAGFVPLGE